MKHWLASAVLLACCCAAAAEDLPRGVVIPSVTCAGSSKQTYALYLPSNYSAQRAWPVLYCLDPGARGRVPVERFAAGAERSGFIVAGSNNSRNGPIEPVKEAIHAIVEDTHTRLSIDDSRVYAAGFSGGSRIALIWAQSSHFAGVVACGAAWGPEGMPKQLPFLLYMAAGVDDFNHDEMWETSVALAKSGAPHRFVVFDGTHEWLPASLAAEALQFFRGEVPPLAATDSKADRNQAEKAKEFLGQVATLTGADRARLFGRLRDGAAKPDDSPDRRVARRVLGGTFVGSLEEARPLMEARNFKAAADVYEVAVLARPDVAEVWLSLARAQAGAGNKDRALKALGLAVEKGMKDRARIENDPLLTPLKRDRRYAAALASIP